MPTLMTARHYLKQPARPRRVIARRNGLAGLLLAVVASVLACSPAIADDTVSPSQIRALKEEIAGIDDWLKDAEKDESQLEQTLARAERDISRLKKERRALQKKTAEQEAELDELNNKMQQLQDTLHAQREALSAQIRTAWMEGDAPAIKVLLNEIDPQKLARLMTYHEYISRYSLEQLAAFNRTLKALQSTREQVTEAQLDLAQTAASLADRQSALEKQHKARERTLALLKSDISKKRSRRDSLIADRKRLEKLLKEVEAAIADIPTPKESQPFSTLRAKLPWPTRGKVIIGFGENLHGGRLKHNGLLISTSAEAEIKAVHYGRVVFSNWLRGFGLLTIIDHGGGYMSLYGRNSSLLKSPGDWVKAGEPIAIAGDSGQGSGSQLYFEIRSKGKPQNPLKWLGKR